MQATAAAAALALAASCSPPQGGVPERFGATGELIAMSGADAGPQNACFTCHGIRGEGDGAGVPRVAGLNAGYLQHQLQAYADGRRQDLSMRWIARQLSPAQRVEVARYYSNMPVPTATAGPAGQPPQLFLAGDPGRNLPACASCHGVDGRGIGTGIPPLAGQPAAYLADQLEQWRRSKRRSDPDEVMLRIARSLTPSEISALSSYASALPAAPRPRAPAEASPQARRSDPRNGVSALPRRVAGS